MFSNGIKSANQIQVQTEDGEPIVPVAGADGAMKVEVVSGTAGNAETTLNASVQNVGTEATTIAINKKVTQIDIANYSDAADVTLTAGGISAVIGRNIATTIKINKQVDNISLVSTAADTKVQLVVSGVE